jgi:hypothetical protein
MIGEEEISAEKLLYLRDAGVFYNPQKMIKFYFLWNLYFAASINYICLAAEKNRNLTTPTTN